MMSIRAQLTTSVLLLHLLLAPTSAQDQNACLAIWLFKIPCTGVVRSLVHQVITLSIQQKCFDVEEKCLYEIIEAHPTNFKVQQISTSTNKTTVMTFDYNPPAAPNFCKIRVVSKADLFATGPNDYCLMHNLISASGLTKAEGYKEICTETMCPSKTTAVCNLEEWSSVL